MVNIVVGYMDFPGAERALDWAARYAGAFDGKVSVVTSLIGGANTSREDIGHARNGLERARARIEARGVPVETELLCRGLDPGEDVVAYAREVNAELAVIAIRKRSKVGKLLFGSDAQHIILNAPCPVVAVQ